MKTRIVWERERVRAESRKRKTRPRKFVMSQQNKLMVHAFFRPARKETKRNGALRLSPFQKIGIKVVCDPGCDKFAGKAFTKLPYALRGFSVT